MSFYSAVGNSGELLSVFYTIDKTSSEVPAEYYQNFTFPVPSLRSHRLYMKTQLVLRARQEN